jgi:hypothetical protein
MKQTRQYTVPDHLIEAYAHLPISRSAAMSMAITQAHKNAQVVVEALRARLVNPPDDLAFVRKTSKVTVSFDAKIVERLGHLSDVTQLPTEQALRLAMEAYISKQ